ncbi:MAG: hypothetical protein HY849_06430 [Nitrosomonadales bacterium]|nr:hypothetical protein [Nitrosomonadales bacterium]
MTDFLDRISESLRAREIKFREKNRQAAIQAELDEDYQQVDRSALSKLSDKDLAKWQSPYPPESAQFILAEHEWQRRLMSAQVRASHFAAWRGYLGLALVRF